MKLPPFIESCFGLPEFNGTLYCDNFCAPGTSFEVRILRMSTTTTRLLFRTAQGSSFPDPYKLSPLVRGQGAVHKLRGYILMQKP